ncbi:MAG: hypothetical protein HYR56_13180 [Acidobacteria bacterium]|nr:hypothetical protein [Acidobacteriota bacterium]MBI3428164.1 hypothetical protein [Acidobacteriota bacterium]
MKRLSFAMTFVLAISAFILWPGGSRPQAAPAAPVVIDFENLASGSPVTGQYAAQGITFNSVKVLRYPSIPGFTHSGVQAVEQCFAQEFCSAPIDMSFTAAQRRVKVWVGLSTPFSVSTTVLLRVLDANGAQIGQATAAFNASNSPQLIRTPLEVTVSSARIRRAIVSFSPTTSATNSLAVDDIEFDSAGPPPPCPSTQPPTLNFIQPANGQTVQFNGFMLEAQVNSLDTLATALTLTANGPNGATRSTVLTLNNGKYGPIHFNDFLFVGVNTLTLKYQDCKGTVQSSRTITYAPIPAGTRFELMSIEVTQATQDARNGVPLIANKPAVARVFLRIQPPAGQNVAINDVRGFLTAQRRNGKVLGDFLAPGSLRPLNLITATASTDLNARRQSFTASLNFELPAAWTAAGDLHLSFRPDIKDSPTSPSNLPCTNCDNGNPLNTSLPLFVKFSPTRPMNLILVPFVYQPRNEPPFPLSAELLFTPAGALQWTNNVYPLPGNFPSDSAGINLIRILPRRTTTRNLQTQSGKDAFLADLQSLLASLQSQSGSNIPSDTRLLGMVPCGCGGEAYLNGRAGFVDTWAEENGPVPAANFEGYGTTWAHELGHTFGRSHAGNWHGEAGGGGFDANYPNFHGGIGQPGLALITEWWRAGGTPYFIAPGAANPEALGPHAHDFMSYGQNDPLNTGFWVSPYTYTALFSKFKLSTSLKVGFVTDQTLAQRSLPEEKPAEKLVASGQLGADGTVELQPFYRTSTAFSSGDGATGEFSLELLDAKDRVLIAHHFDAQAVSHDEAGTLGFTEFVPWNADAQRIVLKRKDAILAVRSVSSHAPSVQVISPNGGEWLSNKAVIEWEASDADGDALSYDVLYNNGVDATWWPLATGVTATSLSVDTALWPGSDQGRVMVRATDGVNSTEAVSDKPFVVPQKAPLVGILNADAAQLTAIAYDAEDGLLPAANLTWTSDRDGRLAPGRQVKLQGLSSGNHVITLTVTDSQGHTATAQVTKLVK